MHHKHLVIGDAHAKPGVHNERFAWLAEWALEARPDVIIDMGDWADMPSLSSYDKGHKNFEGRRYTKDVDAARQARAMFNAPINAHNARYPKDQYLPRKVALGGNHCEGRISRVMELQPEFDGLITHHDLGAEEYGWEYVPYQKPIQIHGIMYCHYFPSGIMARPIGGEHGAATLIKKMFVSCVAAHSHLRDFAERTRADGVKICGLIAGCYFEHREGYAGAANDMWWRGGVMLEEVSNGFFDPHFKRIQTLKREYN